ncbi:membrane with 12+xtransmembrane domain [Cryptosporidium sp. chipmunk genotype I]|uniref:membrane with 12+xtransmembrane domain n=1 Tax=Cryptosporidium sp. chipmunk genotype I TaxID=1280935 RepID=UPI00351AAC53|nr:membrane with 12+xtransmembrane domain [Cryptosporidium sp. chipmunk genotype I]
MENFNSIPAVNYRGNYPGQSFRETNFDEEYDSSESEFSFPVTGSTNSANIKTPGKNKTFNGREKEKAKRYYIQSTLEVNIDNQYPVDNIEMYRQKIFPFQLSPNISLIAPEEKNGNKSRIYKIWKALSNSEPSIIGIVRGKGFVYTLPETIDLLLYIVFSFLFMMAILFFNSSGNVKHSIHNMLSHQTFNFQSSLASECLGMPDENGVSSYDQIYSKKFMQYITTPDKDIFFNSLNNNVVFPCGRGTIKDVATIADYLRWIAIVLFPSFINIRGTMNSALTSQIKISTQFNNGTESELEYVHDKGVLKGNNMYIYPYDTESALEFLDYIVELNYFNRSEVSSINTRFFAYNPFVGIKTSVLISLEDSKITGYYNSNLDVKSLLIHTNSYSYLFMVLGMISGFFGFFRFFTHKDVILSPIMTIKSSMNRMFALLSSILVITSVVTYMCIFIPINWLWTEDSSLQYSNMLSLHDDQLDENFTEQSTHFEYLATCDTIFRISGSTSLIFALWEFFWFLSVKISRKHATSITVVVKKVTFPILFGAMMIVFFFSSYGLVGLILLGEYTSMYSTVKSILFHMLLLIAGKADEIWILVNETGIYTGIFFVPIICIFGIILPSYVYALFCHIYNSTIDTVEWCWDNCSREIETKIQSSPWYIEESSIYEKNTQENGLSSQKINELKMINSNESQEVNINRYRSSQMNDLLFVRDRYSNFMAQSTTFEKLFDIFFSRKKYLTFKQKKELEMSKFDSYEQTRKIASLHGNSVNNLDKSSSSSANNNEANERSSIIKQQSQSEVLQGSEYYTLVTKSIHEYYWSIFNSGKTIFSNPGTVSNYGNNISSTSQQLMYRMVGTMESSVDMTQFLISKNRDSDYSDSIGLNDQNGLPLLVGNVMAASPCPNMENLLTFTEKINRIGESIWFGVLLFFILIALIVSSIFEFRKQIYGDLINTVSWNQFYTDININMMKPIYAKVELDSIELGTPTKFIQSPVTLNLLTSETPNEIAYWISMASSRLIFNSSSEYQYKVLFPNIKNDITEPKILFNQNLLYGEQGQAGITLRAITVTEDRSVDQYIHGSSSADELFKFSGITERFFSSYSDDDKKLSEDLNMKFIDKTINGYPFFYTKTIVPDDFSSYFENIYSDIYELLHYPKLVYLEILLPSLLIEDQIFNYVRIIVTRDLTGRVNKEPLNVLLSTINSQFDSYLKLSIEIAIFLLTIAYIVVFSLECKKFTKIYRNSPESTGRRARSAVFCFFNYIFTDISRAHDLVIIIMIIIRSAVYLSIIYYKMVLFQSKIDTSDFDMVYELSVQFSYINVAIIWFFILRLFGQFSSISSNFRFLAFSYKRSLLPLFLIFIFLALQFIGLSIMIFINFSSCNDDYSTLFGVISSTINLFVGNFDFYDAYNCSSNLTTGILLPLLIAIYYIIMPVHTVVILRSLWLSKKESTDIDRIFKIVAESRNKKNSEEYRKYIKHITGMSAQISEREIWDYAGIDYDEDDPIDRKMYEQKYEKSVSKAEIVPPKIAELTDEQWDASPDFIKEWAEYEAESFIDRFRCLENEFKMSTSSTGYYSQFVSKWESSVYKELQLLEVTTNEAEQLLKRLQRAIKGAASRLRINQALQTNNLEAAIREKEEERESKRELLKSRKNRNIYN